jgi:hypothetical protein
VHATELDAATRTDLVAHLARVRHDLGRYVALQQRWLGDDATAEARAEALAADLLATRRGPEGTTDAVTVWADLRPPLVGEAPLPGGAMVDLTGDADLERLDAAMRDVARAIEGLRAADASVVERGAAAAVEVAAACDALWRRWRTGSP